MSGILTELLSLHRCLSAIRTSEQSNPMSRLERQDFLLPSLTRCLRVASLFSSFLFASIFSWFLWNFLEVSSTLLVIVDNEDSWSETSKAGRYSCSFM